MPSLLHKCLNCGVYTMKNTCPECGKMVFNVKPPKFSIEDKYGDYRRRMKKIAEDQ